jgi:hypothetical protein
MADDISVTIGKVTELTLITPITDGKAGQLRQVLQALQIKPDSPIKKISTIHFARWVIFDDDTRLLFTSNFDGNWLDYLRDFSTLAPDGIDLIWGNCDGYPGARQFDEFTAWVRENQVKVDLFYPAYPEATVKDVLKALDWKAKTENYLRELQKPPQPGGGGPGPGDSPNP